MVRFVIELLMEKANGQLAILKTCLCSEHINILNHIGNQHVLSAFGAKNGQGYTQPQKVSERIGKGKSMPMEKLQALQQQESSGSPCNTDPQDEACYVGGKQESPRRPYLRHPQIMIS